MEKIFKTTLAICGLAGINLMADSVNSRTRTIGNATVTVYRDSEPSAEPGKPTLDRDVFAIHQDGKIILINAGVGGEGGFHKHFIADGHKPEDVAAVLITSMNPENIGGLLDGHAKVVKHEGGGVSRYLPGAVFLNATLYISKSEKKFVDNIPLVRNPFAPPPLPHQVISAYGDRVVTFESETEILPGITAIEVPEQAITIFTTHDVMFIGSFAAGASMRLKNKEEKTAHDLAMGKNYNGIVSLLDAIEQEGVPDWLANEVVVKKQPRPPTVSTFTRNPASWPMPSDNLAAIDKMLEITTNNAYRKRLEQHRRELLAERAAQEAGNEKNVDEAAEERVAEMFVRMMRRRNLDMIRSGGIGFGIPLTPEEEAMLAAEGVLNLNLNKDETK